MSHTWTALVPMRHESERVPGKNYRDLAGKPLFHHIIETLGGIDRIASIVVDTDSPIIREQCQREFPHVVVIERPLELRGGEVPMNDVLVHDVNQTDGTFYLQTHSTNPLLQLRTIVRAMDRFEASFPDPDSAFGVTRLQTRLWQADGKPLNHDPSVLLRTQDLAPMYEENSCLYLFEKESFLARGNRLGPSPTLMEIPPEEAWDIDEEIDFVVVDCLLRQGQEPKSQG